MAWHVSWFDKQETTILVKLAGNWSWRDFEAASCQGLALRTSKPYTVNIICDLTEGRETPDNKVLAPVMRVYARCSANSGLKIMVGATQFVQVAISVITKVMGGNSDFRYADTIEEAAAMFTETPVRNGT
jgi:hypothetical protein